MHAHRDLVGRRVLVGDAEQLDDVPELAGDGDVGGGDAADALVVDVAGDDRGAECDRGDDRRLGTGVEPLDVGGRIALGVAQPLRLAERDAVVGTLLGHLGEDVVGRSVDDAHHAADRFAPEALAQHADERDPAGDGSFEQQVDVALVGRCEQLGADVGEQLLVGGHDRLAGPQRGHDQPARRLDPTDHLDHEVDVGIDDDAVRVAGEDAVGELDIALARHVADRDPRDLEPHAGSRLDRLGLPADELHQRRSDVAAAEHTDPDRPRLGCHGLEGYGIRQRSALTVRGSPG